MTTRLDDAVDHEKALQRVERFELERRVDRLQEQNTIEVTKRQDLMAKLEAVRASLQAAEESAYIKHVGPQGAEIKDPCTCSSCVVIRGIVAFLERT